MHTQCYFVDEARASRSSIKSPLCTGEYKNIGRKGSRRRGRGSIAPGVWGVLTTVCPLAGGRRRFRCPFALLSQLDHDPPDRSLILSQIHWQACRCRDARTGAARHARRLAYASKPALGCYSRAPVLLIAYGTAAASGYSGKPRPVFGRFHSQFLLAWQ